MYDFCVLTLDTLAECLSKKCPEQLDTAGPLSATD